MATVVATDTDVLIKLMIAGRSELLGHLPPYEFVITPTVLGEIVWEDELKIITGLIRRGVVKVIKVSYESEILQDVISQNMGAGEASTLAVATIEHLWMAADDKRVHNRQSRTHFEGRRLKSFDLVAYAIRLGLMTVEEGDKVKDHLAQHKCKWPFASFRDIL